VGKLLNFERSTPLSRGGGQIVGGTEADYGEFPHQITLLRGGVGGSLMCGGSLISETWVVTAAHCCDGQSASRLAVAVGNHRLNTDDADQENIPLKRIVMHPAYDSSDISNDICMLELEHAATFGDHVAAIALPMSNEEYDAGTKCQVTGWGTTSAGGSIANTLRKVTVPVVSDDDCNDSYSGDIFDSMICAGLDEGGKDSCQGDSGGPFMCGNQLSGIVSWGYGCAEAGYPGVYTQTSYFVDWINGNAF
jgi:trypsin